MQMEQLGISVPFPQPADMGSQPSNRLFERGESKAMLLKTIL
jgi:hypothetical protein